jgi:hypothetical protein
VDRGSPSTQVELKPIDLTTGPVVDSWVESLHLYLGQLRELLPESFPFDYTPASLSALEQVVLEWFDEADELGEDDSLEFVRDVVGYIGEALMRIGGGWWHSDAGPDAIIDPLDPDQLKSLRVRFDPALAARSVSPLVLLADAVTRRTGQLFRTAATTLDRAVARQVAVDPEWAPVKIYTPVLDRLEVPRASQLTDWLSEQEQAFPGWARAHADAGTWDFSPESLDALEALTRRQVTGDVEAATGAQRAFVQQAAWYLGEVLRRSFGGQWRFLPGEPSARVPHGGRPYLERDGDVTDVPILDLDNALDPRFRIPLRASLHSYGG